MLNRNVSIWVLFAALMAFAFGSSFGWSLQPSNLPKHGETSEQSKQETSHHNPLKLFWDWTTRDAVSFYTFVLAIFTGVLGATAIVQIRHLRTANEIARVTAEAARFNAEAARLNAEALIDAERAHLHAVIKQSNLQQALQAAVWYPNSPQMDDGFISNRPAVEFCLKNLGKTPAILREASYQIVQGDVFQKTFEYRIGSIVDPIIDGGAETAPPTPCSLETLFTVGDSRTVLNGKRPLFFYGYATFETAFGRRYEYRWRYVNSGVCWLLDHYEEFEKGGQPQG